MSNAKMLKALESVCMGKRNNARLRCIFVKDGTAYASDGYLLVAVQDAFTESHGSTVIRDATSRNASYAN